MILPRSHEASAPGHGERATPLVLVVLAKADQGRDRGAFRPFACRPSHAAAPVPVGLGVRPQRRVFVSQGRVGIGVLQGKMKRSEEVSCQWRLPGDRPAPAVLLGSKFELQTARRESLTNAKHQCLVRRSCEGRSLQRFGFARCLDWDCAHRRVLARRLTVGRLRCLRAAGGPVPPRTDPA